MADDSIFLLGLGVLVEVLEGLKSLPLGAADARQDLDGKPDGADEE